MKKEDCIFCKSDARPSGEAVIFSDGRDGPPINRVQASELKTKSEIKAKPGHLIFN